MLIPLATSLIYGEDDAMAFVKSIAITAGVGLLAILCFRPRIANMGKREGFLLTALVWVVFSTFGMLPLLIGPTPLTVSEGFLKPCRVLLPRAPQSSPRFPLSRTAY